MSNERKGKMNNSIPQPMTGRWADWPKSITLGECIDNLVKWQTKATNYRLEGHCPYCDAKQLISYVLPEFHTIHGAEETCGYYCGYCGWANSGLRNVDYPCDHLLFVPIQ